MQYLGGKSRTAELIALYLESVRLPRQVFIEPFCGACWVTCRMANPRIASDIHPDLILMWRAVLAGWQPPAEVSEELYRELKHAEPSRLRGFVGFGCSWGGKWFGGYARGHTSALMVRNSILKIVDDLRGVRFFCKDYRTLRPSNALIYADPPYQGQTAYSVKFDHGIFWSIVRKWSLSNTVIVSEYIAPNDFECVLEIPTRTELRVRGKRHPRIERLFRLRS